MVEGAFEDGGVRVDLAHDLAVPCDAAVGVAEGGADAAEPQDADRDVRALLLRDAAHDGGRAVVPEADEAADEAGACIEAARLLAHRDDGKPCGHVGGARAAALPQQVVSRHVTIVMAELSQSLYTPARACVCFGNERQFCKEGGGMREGVLVESVLRR